MRNYIKEVLKNMPAGWLLTTTHRLDIYNEELAKTEFLEQFEELYSNNIATTTALNELPTAYDYIRLGHPLSCVLEWAMGKLNAVDAENVISFSSKTIPVFSILRKNALEGKKTQILHDCALDENFDAAIIKNVYGYEFDLKKVDTNSVDAKFEGSTVFVTTEKEFGLVKINKNIDFYIGLYDHLGSILIVNGEDNKKYISDIQHVRRRETVAMT
ncbi:MAG: cystathionine beta-synthase, partial [Bacteroidetes bacterium]|nr:cystathionine beta-synthase [Bacteroidota bacterium]